MRDNLLALWLCWLLPVLTALLTSYAVYRATGSTALANSAAAGVLVVALVSGATKLGR